MSVNAGRRLTRSVTRMLKSRDWRLGGCRCDLVRIFFYGSISPALLLFKRERSEPASGAGPDCGRRVPASRKSDTLTFTTFCTGCRRSKISPEKLHPFPVRRVSEERLYSHIYYILEIYKFITAIYYYSRILRQNCESNFYSTRSFLYKNFSPFIFFLFLLFFLINSFC